MRTHIIENGCVISTIMATLDEASEAFPDAIVRDAAQGGSIGDSYDEATDTIISAPQPEPTPGQRNAPILAALEAIDRKTPRAVRESIQTGDTSRVIALEAEAASLRAQLVKA